MSKKTNQIDANKTTSDTEEDFMQYSLAHDLKEPVRMISIYTQLLEKKLQKIDSLDEDSIDFIGFIREGTKRVNFMIDGMINLSDAGKSQEQVQSTDIADVLYFVSSNLKLLIEKSGAKVSIIGVLPEVHIRYSHMVRILQNLIENAIKFKTPNHQPIIKISGKKQDNNAIFTVEDNGVGIPKHAAHRVFQPFQHAINGETNIKGSGIGLAICKKLIEQYGGRIWFESEENEGTNFHFELPLSEKGMFEK